MVAVVSGSGLGLFNNSGAAGNSNVGRGREQIFVNTTTGNLVVQSVDDTLSALGLDFAAIRTYNSQGLTDEDNNDQWRLGVHQKVALTAGTVNTAGSVVTKTFGDGTEVKYNWNATRSRYESTDGDGANDFLTWNSTNSTWTWTDGSSRATEEYGLVNAVQRIKFSRDTDGNAITYNYTGALLTSLNMAGATAQTVNFTYSGNNLTAISVVSNGVTQTLTRYSYDASNRLQTVTVDLTPGDNSVADNVTYTTTYTYDSTSKRIASIAQKDGSSVAFTYQNINGNYRLKTATDAQGRVTTFNYSTVTGTPSIYQQTDVVDALGLTTTYLKDTAGRLLSVQTPTVGGARIETRYTYDATSGNVATITEDPTGLNRVTTFTYDANTGLLLSSRDSLGNTVTRTYNTSNQVDSETSYLVRDPDGAGTGQPSSPLVSRFVYDGESHLRFAITPDGRVTEHIYNTAGDRLTTFAYASSTYTGAYDETSLNTWATAAARRGGALERTEYAYDFRSNISTISRWAATNSTGVGTGTASVTRFVYDQRGLLLSTVEARGEATSTPTTDYLTSYTYDGLSRLLTVNSWVSSTETARLTQSHSYDDANRRSVSTFANGLTKTLTYNRSGDLTSVVNGPAALGTTNYTYDADARLRVVADATGVKSYSFYDDAGRKLGTVDGDGSLTEFVYNRANQLIKAIRYSTRLGSTTLTSLAGTGWNTIPFATLRTEANVTPAANQIERQVYDASGALVYTIDEIGGVTQNLYDGAGRLTDQVRFLNTQTIAAATDEVLPAAITVVSNAADRRTRYFYNGDGQLIATLDGVGYLKENVYDAAGRLTTTIGYYAAVDSDKRDHSSITTMRPGAAGSTAQLDAARDITIRYFYDAQGREVGVLDGERYLTESVYDVAGKVSQSIRYDRVLTYTAGTSTFATLKTAATGAATQATSFTYDGLGQVLTATNFEGSQTLYSYDVAGNVIKTTRANGVSAEARTTARRYDVMGRVTQELSGEGSVALAALGASPTQTQIDDVWSKYGIAYTYDNASRRTSMTVRPNDASTLTTYYYYDNDGRLRFELDPRGRVRENRYNALGQLTDSLVYWRTVSIVTPTGGLLTTALTTALTATESANVHEKTTYAYSLRGEVTATTTVAGATTASTFNIFGELQSSNAGSGFTAADYTYDNRGLQKLIKRGSTTFEDRTYDAFGRLATLVDARGNSLTTTYDRLGREVTSLETGDPAARLITYDGFSRVLSVRDKLTNTTSYAYNDTTRTVTVTTPEGIAVATVHNRHGDTLTVTANGNATTYTYDRDGHLTGASDNLGALEGRGYDRAGRQITATDALGTVTTLAYDGSNRVLTRTVDSASGGLQLVTTYAYDTSSRIMNVTEPGGRLTRTQYDRDGRVSSIIEDPSGTTPRRTDYAYDAASNLVQVTAGVGSANLRRTLYVYDALGRRSDEYVDPTSLGGTLNLRTQYRYDNNDNVTRKIDARGNSTWFVYDAQNRLLQTIDALGGVTENTYDAEDRLLVTRRYFNTVATGAFGDAPALQTLTTSVNDQVVRTVYDLDGRAKYTLDRISATGTNGTTSISVVTERTFDAGGNVTRTRIYRNSITVPTTVSPSTIASALTAAGNDIATPHADDRVQWTAYDVRGRVVFSVDGTGAVVKSAYDASGNVKAIIAYATSIALTNLMTTASLTTWSDQTAVANYPRNRVTRFWYDTLSRQRFSLDGEGYLTETKYLDSANQKQQTVYAGKPTVAASATLAQVVTAAAAAPNQTANQTVTQLFDVGGRVTQVTDANGKSEYFVYDTVGNKISYVNKKAASATDVAYTWTYEYDAAGRLTFERSPSVTYSGVNASTLVVTDTTAQVVTRNEYDALGNVTARTEAYGTAQARITRYEYDLLGRQTATVSPTVGIYTAAGDTTFGNGTAVAVTETQTEVRSETAYDVFGNAFRNCLVTTAEAATAGAGTFTYKVYDVLGRVRYEVDARNYVTSYVYDVFGNKQQVTRHAAALGSTSTWQTANSVVQSQVSVSASATVDRTITSTFDRQGRELTVKQPSVRNFAPTANAAGGGYYNAQPTTAYLYNAFGDLIRTTVQINSTESAVSYAYFDRRGNKTAVLDPGRYLTTFEYDETGDVTRAVEYARPTTGAADVDTYGTIVTTTAAGQPAGSVDSFAGYDRETTAVYDKLNRKTSESKRNLEYSSISAGTLSTQYNGAQTTTFGYDVLGNQILTRSINPVDGTFMNTYTGYDVLGRVVTVAQPVRDIGNGQNRLPLTQMRRDAHGNLIQQIEYYYGGGTVPTDGTAATAATPTPTRDRTTTMVVDNRGNAIRTRDATDADRYASYNARGDIAKEWQVVTNAMGAGTADDVSETIVKLYRYDAVGQTTQVIESQRFNGASTDTATRVAEYNAFGEITYKYNAGTADAQKQFFDYDQAGRVWRSNSGDGVDKVFMYDLAGNATLELRSKETDLSAGRTLVSQGTYTSAQGVLDNVAAANLMRTETVYDAKGNVVQRRMPSFDVDSRFQPVASDIQIGAFSGVSYVYFTPPNYLGATTFWYRAAGSNANYASLTLQSLPGGFLGANVDGLVAGQTYEFRITAGFAGEIQPMAESVGTFRIDRSTVTTYAISRTAPDTSNDVNTISVSASGPLPITSAQITDSSDWYNTGQPPNGGQWIYDNKAMVSWPAIGAGTRVRVYISYQNYNNNYTPGVNKTYDSGVVTNVSGGGEFIWPTPDATTAERGGLYQINSVTVYSVDANGNNLAIIRQTGATGGPPKMIWLAPANTGVTAVFKYKRTVESTFASVSATRVGGDFQVDVQTLLTAASTYDYEVEHWLNGTLIAKKSGQLNSSGVVTTRTSSGSIAEGSLDAWSQTVGVPSVNGLSMVWAAPPTTYGAVSATFEYRQSGASTYTPRAITTGAPWSVSLGDLPQNVTHEYQITYTLGGRVVAQQRGTFVVQFTAASTTTTVTGTGLDNQPTPVGNVAVLSGVNGLSGVTGGINDSSDWYYTGQPPNDGQWIYDNKVQVGYSNVGSQLIKIRINYQNYNNNYSPGSNTSYTTGVITLPTGGEIVWPTPNASSSTRGGIYQITSIEVYAVDAAGNFLATLRQTGATGTAGPPRMTWNAPAESGLTARFWANGVERTVTQSGGTLTADLTGLASGDYSYEIGYYRSGDPQSIVYSSGTLRTNTVTTSVLSQTYGSRNPSWIGVSATGNTVSWSRVADQGSNIAFEYWNGSSWVAPGVNAAGDNTNFWVNVQGLASGTYSYRLSYSNGAGYLPYVLSTGTFSVSTTVTTNTTVLNLGAPSFNQAYPPTRVTPVGLSTDVVSWSYAKQYSSGDTITFRYTVNGTTYTAPVSGSGPGYSAQMSSLPFGSNMAVSWRLEYTRSGETQPYAQANGSATMTVTGTTTNPTVTVVSQNAVYPSGVAEISTPYDLGGGYFAWDTAPNGATVTFKYNGTTVATEAYGTGGRVNLSALAAGTYSYEITYVSGGNTVARAIGNFTVGKQTGAVTGRTLSNSAQRADTTLAFTPSIGVTTLVDPPYAVYHQEWSQVIGPDGNVTGGYVLKYGAMPWAAENTSNAGGFYYTTFPNEQDPDGAWSQVPQANYFYGNRLAITVPATGLGVDAKIEFWPLSNPGAVSTAKVSNPNGDAFVADIQGAGGIANGNYGYRITIIRQGAALPLGVQEGTFVVGSTNSITVGASASPAPVVATPTTKQKFDRWGNVIQVTDAANNTSDYRYNGLNLLVQTLEAQDYVFDKRDAAGIKAIEGVNVRAEKTNSYDLLGRLIETQDGYDQATRAGYNAGSQQVTQRNADYARYSGGATVSNVYDIFGNLIQVTDALGYLTRMKYDRLGRLTEVWREIDLNVFTNRTDATSTAVANAALVQSQFYTYDQAGRRIVETNGAGETIRYRYDFFGNLTLKRTNLGFTTTYVYNVDGKKTAETDALSSIASWNYDVFGQLMSHAEFSSVVAGVAVTNGTTLTYTYNYAGMRVTQTGGGTSIAWAYDRGGNVASITDGAVNRKTSYRYDLAGRQARETVVVDQRLHQDTRITYDNHNRIKNLDDPDFRERFLFDVNGNRAYVLAVYPDHERRVLDETYTYTYDEMNRVTQTVTYLRDAQQNFITDYTYNGRGDRVLQVAPGTPWAVNGSYYKLANGFTARVAEQYAYDGLGRLLNVNRNLYDSNPTNILLRSYTYDLANRQKTEYTRNVESATAFVARTSTTNYDGDGRATSQTTTKSTNGGSVVNESAVSYGSGSSTYNGTTWSLGFDAANNLRGYEVQFYTPGGGTSYKTTFKTNYQLGDGYLERVQTATSTGSGAPQPGETERYYNVNDELIKFRDQADAKRTRYFVNNQAGQVLTAIQTDATDQNPYWNSAMVRSQVGSAWNTGKAQYFFYAQNNQVGSFGQAKEGARYKAHFDVNSTPISDNYPAATPSTVVAQAGDTLRSIAARVFGDASLWYVIAEENGLSDADADLADGMQLRVPNDVVSLTNTSNSFKPYNVADALGNVTPTQPPPPAPKGCGVIGMIIMIVVMIVATIFTAGVAAAGFGAGLSTIMASGASVMLGGAMVAGTAVAASSLSLGFIGTAALAGAVGSVVSQGVGIAIGAQDKFDWKQVGISAISAGVTAGFGAAGLGAKVAGSLGIKGTTAVKYASAVFNAAAGSAVTQGVSVAAGLQDKFSWRSVAQAAVAAPIARYVGDTVAGAMGGEAALQADGYNITKFASDAASRVVSAGVRAAMGGRFDVVQVAADVFGNAIGNAIVDTLAARAPAERQQRVRESIAKTDPGALPAYDTLIARGATPEAAKDVVSNPFTRNAVLTAHEAEGRFYQLVDDGMTAEQAWNAPLEDDGDDYVPRAAGQGNLDLDGDDVPDIQTYNKTTVGMAILSAAGDLSAKLEGVPVAEIATAVRLALFGPIAVIKDLAMGLVIDAVAGKTIEAVVDWTTSTMVAAAHDTSYDTVSELMENREMFADGVAELAGAAAGSDAEKLQQLRQRSVNLADELLHEKEGANLLIELAGIGTSLFGRRGSGKPELHVDGPNGRGGMGNGRHGEYDTRPDVVNMAPPGPRPMIGHNRGPGYEPLGNPPSGWGRGQIPCFPAGTLVATPNGHLPIEDIVLGQEVFAFDFPTQTQLTRKVAAVYHGKTNSWVDISLADETIRATRKHPVWVHSEQRWLPAEALEIGMTVTTRDGSLRMIDGLETHALRELAPTFNLTIEETNNFYAGDVELLVHNDDSRMNRPGYSVYMLKDSSGRVYYSGMFGPNQTLDDVIARHSANNDRFNQSNRDTIHVVKDDLTYRQARMLEHDNAVRWQTYIGRDGDSYRGNRQFPMSDRSFWRYYPADAC